MPRPIKATRKDWTNVAPGRVVDEPLGRSGHAQGPKVDDARDELAGEWLAVLRHCEEDGQRFVDVVGNYLKGARRSNRNILHRWRRQLLTTNEAAALAGCSVQMIIRQCEGGELPYHKIGTHRRIQFAAFVGWAAARGIPLPEGLEL